MAQAALRHEIGLTKGWLSVVHPYQITEENGVWVYLAQSWIVSDTAFRCQQPILTILDEPGGAE